MEDLGTVGVQYCCSKTEVRLVLENITSVIICCYSPSKSIVAAIRTTRKKAALPFMLLEE